MAEPHVFDVEQTAEIIFDSVKWFQVTEELFDAVAFSERSNDERFDGQYFRRYSRSALLGELGKGLPDEQAARLKHYQLVTGDEVIDVLSVEAPRVTFRGESLK